MARLAATGADPARDGQAGLRAEHDLLSARLAVRRSIDSVRVGAYASFLLVVTGGLTLKFAWDRWGWGPKLAPLSRVPVLFLVALGIAVACLAVAVAAFRKARRLGVEEDRDFARLQELRRELGIES
jgi:hypothetical protein